MTRKLKTRATIQNWEKRAMMQNWEIVIAKNHRGVVASGQKRAIARGLNGVIE
jgi:hypothetical protein